MRGRYWMMVAAAAAVAGLGACKREPAKAGAGTNAPTITGRPVRNAGPSPEETEAENRARMLENLYDLPVFGADGVVYTAEDGEVWSRFPSGLMIHELRPSQEGQPPKLGQMVSVAYTGMFPGGKIFDQRTAAKPLTFKMGSKDFVRGFSMALQTMHVGGKRRVYLPADLAYGERGNLPANILPNQPLIFEIELLSITGEGIQFRIDDLPKFSPMGPPAPPPASAPGSKE